MCGIAGFTHRDWCVDRERIRGATACLIHRGPDQQGVFHSNIVSLGAVRLRIIDLAGGDQPITSNDGDTTIVFNGEIYNHAELRAELSSLGHHFRSRSDTEVLLEAFREWDVECFRRLRGMFAVALWSDSRKRLVLARDRLGIKPVYYYKLGADLIFGSELKAILVHPEVPRKLNLTGLGHYLSLNYVPCPHTLVAGIDKVPPGHWMEWIDGRVTTGAYWQLRLEPQPHWTLEAAKEALDDHLRQAVKEHLISDVPLGVWASGGLDSSTLLHYASEQSSTKLKTFSVSFQGHGFDESRFFREVARVYNTDHCELDLNATLDLTGAIENAAYYSDEPTADAGAVPLWFLSKATREHVTVVLSGEGADELFGGYLTYRADLIAERLRLIPAPLRRLATRALQLWPVSNDKISLEYKVKRMMAGSLLPPDEAHCYWNGTFSSAEKFAICQAQSHLSELYAIGHGDTLRGIDRYLWFDQQYFLTDNILMKCDRMSMAHALELRPAFLDHRIAEFAASLPNHLKIRGSNQKYVLRELMRGKLPSAVLKRKKEGFDIPVHAWLRGPLRELLLETLNYDTVARSQVFSAEGVQELIKAHLERRRNVGYHLWGLMTLFLWMKRWDISSTDLELKDAEVSA
ncbi:MAG TPA: asparagine synthase (glutamine-hydrolyzing) [Bryobacteraceae bacterium]|nr:asparagine synthase (glutamine-hydrolyzing) [Bryobacteraceae bacterium]